MNESKPHSRCIHRYSTLRRRLAASCLGALLFLFGVPLAAQSYFPEENTLRATLEAAEKAEDEHPEVARDLYARAIVMFNHTEAFADVGRFHMQRNELQLARASLERFLKHHPRSWRADRVHAWMDGIERCEALRRSGDDCRLLEVRSSPRGAQIFVDDQRKPVGTTPHVLAFDTDGKYRITVQAPKRQPASKVVLVARSYQRTNFSPRMAEPPPAAVADGNDGWPPLTDEPRVEATGRRDVALLVGVEDYAFLPDIPGARENIAAWKRFLTDGLEVRETFVLTDEQATREEILEFASRAAKATRAGGTLWVVFIGHGAVHDDEGVLVGVDGQGTPRSIASRSVQQTELMQALSVGRQKRTVVALDSCFSGRDRQGSAVVDVMPALPVGWELPDDTETIVLTAAQGDQFAGLLADGSRPAFSYLLLGALRGWADDGDGDVTADEALGWVRRELRRIPGRTQTPVLYGDGDAVLTRGASERPPRLLHVRKPSSDRPDRSSTRETTKKIDDMLDEIELMF